LSVRRDGLHEFSLLLDQAWVTRSSRATCCPRHSFMLLAETFETKNEKPFNPFLAKEGWNAEASPPVYWQILKDYLPLLYLHISKWPYHKFYF
jgi:hypothetical protein